MWYSKLFLCLFLVNVVAVHGQNDHKINVICYYLNGYGTKLAPPESLDPNLCTHILYAFATLDSEGNLSPQNKNVDIDKEMYKRVLSLKKENSKLKVLISIGDTNADVFAQVAANATKRRRFVDSSTSFLGKHGFDGLDVDWEKPGKADSGNFVSMLKDLRTGLERNNKLLSIAVYPNPSEGYNVPEITKHVHMVNLMCYNYYGPWSQYTGYNSPLFSSSAESIYEKTHLNIAASLTNWIEAGTPKNKINIGIPFYGRTFTLVNPENHGFHSPISGAGTPATVSYSLICSTFNNYTKVWDDEQKVPYKYYKDQWLTYEDERSIEEKTKYVISQNVAGIMIWQIGMDDVKGECGRKQGLLRVINDNINKANLSTLGSQGMKKKKYV